jgi:Molybdopterin cofactor-binding domain
MRPFSYSRAGSVQAAIGAQAPSELPPDAATVHAPNQFVAGGTTLIDLMKLDVMRPARRSATTGKLLRSFLPTHSRLPAKAPIGPRSCTFPSSPARFDSPGVTEEDASKVNERAEELPEAGDADAAIAAAEVTFEAEYETPTQHHNAIELFTTTCVWNDDELTIYEPSQFVYGLKNSVAQKLGIPADKIRVVSPFVGALSAQSRNSPHARPSSRTRPENSIGP